MTREFLKNLFPEITDANLKTVLDENSSDIGTAKSSEKGYKDKLETANTTITELNDTIKKSEGSDTTIAELKTKVEEYETAEVKRKDAEKVALVDAQFASTIEDFFASEGMKDKKFANEYTKSAFTNSLKSELGKSENTGKGVSDLFNVLTKDKEGIFKNPQEPLNIPATGNPTGDIADDKVRSVMGLPPTKQ